MENIKELDHLLAQVTKVIWDMNDKELERLKEERPRFWQYCLDMCIVKE